MTQRKILSRKFLSAASGVTCLLCLTPVLALFLWLAGHYNYTTEDGYQGKLIASFFLRFVVVPSIVIGVVLLILAIRAARRERYGWAVVSTAYGCVALFVTLSIIIG
ncbi:MAG TPA: hypothetical protein VLH38_00630 [Patescibacteria group bacterium]|nr:hypothetical protein [Patescibacteria group bacterium]